MYSDLERRSRNDELKSKDATFLENEFPKKGNIDKSHSLYEIIESDVDNTSEVFVPFEWNLNDVRLSRSLV